MFGENKIKIDMRTLKLFTAITLLFILQPFSCKDDVVPPKGDTEPGILRTDEFGNILGGDSTDWCWRGASNGFKFGPAYPNPVTGITFTIPMQLPVADRVRLYYLRSHSDTAVIYSDSLPAGNHGFGISVQGNNFTSAYVRFYVQCNSFSSSDSCRNYGDVKFEE
jgi:hypothetical protein